MNADLEYFLENIQAACEEMDEMDNSYIHEGATEEELQIWEMETGIRIPQIYKEWLLLSRYSYFFGGLLELFMPSADGYFGALVDEEYVVIGNMIGDGERICFHKESGDFIRYGHEFIRKIGDFCDILKWLDEFLEIIWTNRGKVKYVKEQEVKRWAAIRDFWLHERELISEGRYSRPWTAEEEEDIFNIRPDMGNKRELAGKPIKAVDEHGTPIRYEGHHIYRAANHPEYTCDWELLSAMTPEEYVSAAYTGCAVEGGDSYDETELPEEFGAAVDEADSGQDGQVQTEEDAEVSVPDAYVQEPEERGFREADSGPEAEVYAEEDAEVSVPDAYVQELEERGVREADSGPDGQVQTEEDARVSVPDAGWSTVVTEEESPMVRILAAADCIMKFLKEAFSDEKGINANSWCYVLSAVTGTSIAMTAKDTGMGISRYLFEGEISVWTLIMTQYSKEHGEVAVLDLKKMMKKEISGELGDATVHLWDGTRNPYVEIEKAKETCEGLKNKLEPYHLKLEEYPVVFAEALLQVILAVENVFPKNHGCLEMCMETVMFFARMEV